MPNTTFPARPIPVDGESYRSLLLRASNLNHLTREDLAQRHNLTLDNQPTPSQLATTAALIAVPVDDLGETTLDRWNGTAYQLTPTRHPNPWQWIVQPPRCIACSEGLLIWHLPWITTCQQHRRLLGNADATQAELRHAEQFTAYFTMLLNQPGPATLEIFDTWRDAVTLTVALDQALPRGHTPLERLATLQAAAPLACSQPPEMRAEALARLLRHARLSTPRILMRRQPTSRTFRDAFDCIDADRWRLHHRAA